LNDHDYYYYYFNLENDQPFFVGEMIDCSFQYLL